ncbi:sialidase family protein [Pseudoxanthomonas putridarboris]|uniref:Sialidase family protein n=1 Tax=Pseudoxanthomonas putridarboris TaxID=752605 RepID=A0ABU9IZR5_9GAMM
MRTSTRLKSVVLGVALLLIAPAVVAQVSWGETITIVEHDAGWARMARLPDGRWLAVTTHFHKDRPTTLAISIGDARARNWRPWSMVAEPGRMIDNGELFVMPDGRILLGMRSLIDGKSYRLNLYASDDQARSFQFLSTIDANEAPAGRNDRGVWEPVLTLLEDGSLSVLYADETLADGAPSYNQVVSQRLSSDGGKTWQAKQAIVKQAGGGHLRPGMPVMARLKDGRYLLVFETCGDDKHCPVSFKVSADGRSWPEGLGILLPDQRCGPQIMTTTQGRTFVTSCQNEVSWTDDAGEHWQRIAEPAWPFGFRHSWPAIYQTGTHEIGVINIDMGSARVRFGRMDPAATP